MNGGKFVGENARLVCSIFEASAVSGLHAMINGQPGCGKSDMATTAAEIMFPDAWHIFEIDPSMPPEEMIGRPDPKKWATTGDYEIVLDGTIFDPNKRLFILDEYSRGMDALRYASIKGLTRMSELARQIMRQRGDAELPVMWATNNFWPKTEGNEAVLSRFPLIAWLTDEEFDVSEIVHQHMKSMGGLLSLDYPFPDATQIAKVRGWRPGDEVTQAVEDVIGVLVEEISNYNRPDSAFKFLVRPRNFRQWSALLYRLSCLRYDDPNPAVVHEDAIGLLAYAWPTHDESEAAAWQSITNKICDPLQGAINNIFATAHEKMRGYNGDPSEKAIILGRYLDTAKDNLRDLARRRNLINPATNEYTDPRIKKCESDLLIAMAEIVRG